MSIGGPHEVLPPHAPAISATTGGPAVAGSRRARGLGSRGRAAHGHAPTPAESAARLGPDLLPEQHALARVLPGRPDLRAYVLRRQRQVPLHRRCHIPAIQLDAPGVAAGQRIPIGLSSFVRGASSADLHVIRIELRELGHAIPPLATRPLLAPEDPSGISVHLVSGARRSPRPPRARPVASAAARGRARRRGSRAPAARP